MINKAFIHFVIKEFKHIFRDVRTLLVLFGMPVAQLIIFGYAVRTEINNADIAVFDKSLDPLTREIRQKFSTSDYFRINADISNETEIEPEFRSGKVQAVIVFDKDFAKNLESGKKVTIQLLIDASNPNTATLLQSYINSIINDFKKGMIVDSPNSGYIINIEPRMYYNPELKSVNMFVPGLTALILMLVSALLTSIAITKEKETGTMEVLLVSPLKPLTIIIGKVLPYALLALINALSILIIAILIFEVPFKGSVILFFAESLLFIFTALSLGILISTAVKTQQVALMISLAGLLMPTVLLSGFIFPVENMPVFLQIISNVIPAKWFLIILKSIMIKGIGIEYFFKETLILAGMAVFFLTISMKRFKLRLE